MLVAFYNIHMYEGASIFRAVSPHYIVIWFQRNGTMGWMKLAGVFLCLTGWPEDDRNDRNRQLNSVNACTTQALLIIHPSAWLNVGACI